MVQGQRALRRIVAEQARRLEEQPGRVERLPKRIEELTRAGKRQAAPFRKEEPEGPLRRAQRREKNEPRRKPGGEHGEHRRREEPLGEPMRTG